MILQLIPAVSSLEPITTVAPFMVIIFVGLLREGLEDLYRYKKDKRINNSPARVFNTKSNQIELKIWRNIREGDLVLLIEDEETPADLLVIYSKGTTPNAYIETSNLDGEKNLKSKYPLRKYFSNSNFSNPNLNDFSLSYPFPNEDIYTFEGYAVDNESKIYLNKDNFVPRGVFIKNTRFLLGLVVYVGKETKIMMNNMFKQNKISSVDKMMNIYVVILVIVEVILLFILAILSAVTTTDNVEFFLWMGIQIPNVFSEFIIVFSSYFIILNTFLPISLIVTIETSRLFQVMFYKWDDTFKHDGSTIMTNTTTLNEDLGKIEYVLSDKTGTLTENIMIAKNFAIGTEEIKLKENSHPKKLNDSLKNNLIPKNIIKIGKNNKTMNLMKRSNSMPEKEKNQTNLKLKKKLNSFKNFNKPEILSKSLESINKNDRKSSNKKCESDNGSDFKEIQEEISIECKFYKI